MEPLTASEINEAIAVYYGARIDDQTGKIIGYSCPPSDDMPDGGFLLLDHPHEIPDYLADLRQVETRPIIEAIKRLRGKYLDFAKDQTRVNSMRVMAASFADDLVKLLSGAE